LTPQRIAEYDKQLALVVQKICDSKARQAFFASYGKDPKGFLRRWVGSQKRDLEVIRGDGRVEEGELREEFRRGGKEGVWGQEVVREAVGLMVAKPQGR
jgi:SWI/SNF-related matrix-associated actin-dependent regulator of chromatin subfamily D